MGWFARTSPSKSQVRFGARPEGVQAWWEEFLGRSACREFWRTHPWLRSKSPEGLKFHLPLMLFDDAGPVSAHNSTFCRVWYSLLGTGSERETRVLLCTGLKYDEGEDRSWQVILEHFERLAGPTEPGTWGGILLFVGADLDYV